MCERGLPPPFEFELIDTKAFRKRPKALPKMNWVEVKRNFLILKQLYCKLASGEFSLVHLNCALTPTGVFRHLISLMIAKHAKVPCVVHLRGRFTLSFENRLVRIFYCRIYRIIFAHAALILTMGKSSYRSVLKLGNFSHKILMLPNFMDFCSVPKHVPNVGQQGTVIFTGALVEAKGIYTILEIAKRLPNVCFQLVGDSSADVYDAFLRRIREQGLENRVQVMGPFSSREIFGALAKSDIFLFPSKFKFEGFPYSVLEAMAVGLPVVASPVGALPEMIDSSKGGYLVDTDDVDGYVQALTRLLDDASLRKRMGQHNREKALREYDYNVVIRNICNLYLQAVQSSPAVAIKKA